MQSQNRLFEDLAKVASGTASTIVGIKQEIDAMVRQRLERLAYELDLVSREEFEAVRGMAEQALNAQQQLEQKLAAIEKRIDAAGLSDKIAENNSDR